MDKDSQMIQELSAALIDFQVKYRAANVMSRMKLRPMLEELLQDFSKYQIRLLKEGTITSEKDIAEMKQIKSDVDAAANEQQLIAAMAKTVAFIATKAI